MKGLPSGQSTSLHLGRYELLCEIAKGGMATVHLGRLLGTAGFERWVAVKCCHPHFRDDREFAAMFLDEARLAARIHHPNVVATLDVGESDCLYLVMEYIEGGTLATLIKHARDTSAGRIPPPIGVRILCDALAGLHAAHELRHSDGSALHLVHRDVSPQNVLCGVDGVARITDFGIAKAESRLAVTLDGSVKGKLGYMSPEQINQRQVDRRADVFAAGVVLWETLAGRRLFAAETAAETLPMILQGSWPLPSTIVPGLPPDLDRVVVKALAREPEERFASAGELAHALERAGIRLADPREVGAFVRDHLGEPIARIQSEMVARSQEQPLRQTLLTRPVVRERRRDLPRIRWQLWVPVLTIATLLSWLIWMWSNPSPGSPAIAPAAALPSAPPANDVTEQPPAPAAVAAQPPAPAEVPTPRATRASPPRKKAPAPTRHKKPAPAPQKKPAPPREEFRPEKFY